MNQTTSPNFPDDADSAQQALAGEYVLGTLSREERQAVDALLGSNPALRAAVDAWQQRLLPLVSLIEPVAPSQRLWQRIERSLDQADAAAKVSPVPARAAPKSVPWWRDVQSLALWRGLTAGGFALATLLAAVLVLKVAAPVPGTRYMVVLVAPQDRSPGWVMQTSSDRKIELIPLGAMEIPADKALELWTKADEWNAPISLGLVKPGERVQVPLDRIPGVQPNQLFELTLEPATGSPTGRPTGPIHFIGRSVKVS